MKKKIETLLTGVEKAAGDLIDNVVQAVDQNDDGKFDLLDVSVIADSVESAMQKGKQAVKDSVDEKSKQHELKMLQPIFADTLVASDFSMPKFIRIVERDGKYIDSPVCQNSIGHWSKEKEVQFVNIFHDSLDAFELNFHPNSDCEFYYVNPSDPKQYISLDKYFNYLKIARINELKMIAMDLGAKYFKVTYKEEQVTLLNKKARVSADAKKVGKVDVDRNTEKKEYTNIKIEAEMDCVAHAPKQPELKYLQNDTSIQTLVAMRLKTDSQLIRDKYVLEMSQSSGMTEKEAAKIDVVLNGLKCAGNATIVSEVQNEARRILEYDIEF